MFSYCCSFDRSLIWHGNVKAYIQFRKYGLADDISFFAREKKERNSDATTLQEFIKLCADAENKIKISTVRLSLCVTCKSNERCWTRTTRKRKKNAHNEGERGNEREKASKENTFHDHLEVAKDEKIIVVFDERMKKKETVNLYVFIIFGWVVVVVAVVVFHQTGWREQRNK